MSPSNARPTAGHSAAQIVAEKALNRALRAVSRRQDRTVQAAQRTFEKQIRRAEARSVLDKAAAWTAFREAEEADFREREKAEVQP